MVVKQWPVHCYTGLGFLSVHYKEVRSASMFSWFTNPLLFFSTFLTWGTDSWHFSFCDGTAERDTTESFSQELVCVWTLFILSAGALHAFLTEGVTYTCAEFDKGWEMRDFFMITFQIWQSVEEITVPC